MRFQPGQTVVRRGLYPDGRVGQLECCRVVSDDDRGLLLWIGHGSTVLRRVDLDGKRTRQLSFYDEITTPTLLIRDIWHAYSNLVLVAPGAAHTIWWSWAPDAAFAGWYVNLETPPVRWFGGVDSHDQTLDVTIAPDRSWQWKDEDEFATVAGHPMFWSWDEADAIRAEGRKVIADAQAGRFPFDGSWCDFRPDPAWPAVQLPWWWDQVPTAPARRTWPAEKWTVNGGPTDGSADADTRTAPPAPDLAPRSSRTAD